MKHSVSHDLDSATAKRVAEHAADAYAQRFAKYDPQVQWVSDSRCMVRFKAKGIKVEGALELEPGKITMEMEVPFLLRIFQKQAVGIIEEEIQSWLGKARAGEI